jgi:heterodisulfide reductase subunit A
LDPLIKAVRKHKKIRVNLETELIDVNGFIGNFTATVRKKDKTKNINVGTIIVAVGANELKPEGIFGYGRFDNVLTQLEFEQRYRNYDDHRRTALLWAVLLHNGHEECRVDQEGQSGC